MGRVARVGDGVGRLRRACRALSCSANVVACSAAVLRAARNSLSAAAPRCIASAAAVSRASSASP
eukprot:scaffold60688_cov54-Phaeocystis_antarctica.AAC.1